MRTTKWVIITLLIITLLLAGCNSSFISLNCNKTTLVKNEAEAKINITTYLQNHTIKECYNYCKGTYWKTFPDRTCYTNNQCANICTGQQT